MKYILAAVAIAAIFDVMPAKAIVNGVDVLEGHPHAKATVYITRRGDSFKCSGVLITDNIALTAAHCMFKKTGDGTERIFSGDIIVVFGVQPRPGKAQIRRSDAIVLHQNFKPLLKPTSDPRQLKRMSGEVDLALVRFLGSRPPGTQVARIADIKDIGRSSLTVVGYGRADGFINDKSVSPTAGTMREFTFPRMRIDKSLQIIVDQTKGGACNGDSGAPVFLDSKKDDLIVVGIYSRGTTKEVGADNRAALRHNFCTGRGAKGMFTNLVPLNEWINSQIEALRYDRMFDSKSK